MASREGDTGLWLHNKLGSTDDLWSGSSICSQLNRDKLLSIQDCFHTLQPYVKVKLMLSFLHLPKRNVEEWRGELDEILQLAADDSDQWVAMVGSILRTYPATGSLNSEIDEHHTFFHHVQSDLKKLVKKSLDVNMQPMECLYLSKNANISVAGQQAPPVKHFALKRKPKSAALRAELLQKSSEAANNMKKQGGASMPFKFRSFAKKMDEETSVTLKPGMRPGSSGSTAGFLKANTLSRSSNYSHRNNSTASRREGGIKLLEIEAIPLGGREAKRRRKMEQQEAQKEKEAQSATTTATPDYAAGLGQAMTAAAGTGRDSLAVLQSASAGGVAAGTGPSYIPTARLPTASTPGHTTLPAGNLSIATQAARDNLQSQLQQQIVQNQAATEATNVTIIQGAAPKAAVPSTAATPTGSAAPTIVRLPPGTTILTAPGPGGKGTQQIIVAKSVAQSGSAKNIKVIQQTAGGTQPTTQLTGQKIQQIQKMPQTGQSLLTTTTAATPQQVQKPQQQQVKVVQQQASTPAATTQQTVTVTQAAQQTQQPQQQIAAKKGLCLTREQMLEAQEMFKTSNKVTRPEKALILGFMAGSRENPCPQQGDIVNIRLSENHESVQQPTGLYQPMIVDVYFQMNYANGEWKKITKFRNPDADL